MTTNKKKATSFYSTANVKNRRRTGKDGEEAREKPDGMGRQGKGKGTGRGRSGRKSNM